MSGVRRRRAVIHSGKAPVAVCNGWPTCSRSRPHIGHKSAEAPATPMGDLRRTGDTHERGRRRLPSTTPRMSAAWASESTLTTLRRRSSLGTACLKADCRGLHRLQPLARRRRSPHTGRRWVHSFRLGDDAGVWCYRPGGAWIGDAQSGVRALYGAPPFFPSALILRVLESSGGLSAPGRCRLVALARPPDGDRRHRLLAGFAGRAADGMRDSDGHSMGSARLR